MRVSNLSFIERGGEGGGSILEVAVFRACMREFLDTVTTMG